jgi:hypothetical protein
LRPCGQPRKRCRSLKILTGGILRCRPTCFLCEHFICFEPRSLRCRPASSSAHTYRLLVVKEPCLTERRVCRRHAYTGCGCRVSRVSQTSAALYRPCCSLSLRALFAAFRDGSRTIAKPSASAKHFFAYNRKMAF